MCDKELRFCRRSISYDPDTVTKWVKRNNFHIRHPEGFLGAGEVYMLTGCYYQSRIHMNALRSINHVAFKTSNMVIYAFHYSYAHAS